VLIFFVDEKGRPLSFYCGEGCPKDIIHKTDIRALQLSDIKKIHAVEPIPQEDQWNTLEKSFMFVLACLSGVGYIKESDLAETKEISAHKLRLINSSTISICFKGFFAALFN
jgi:hypothetical protein